MDQLEIQVNMGEGEEVAGAVIMEEGIVAGAGQGVELEAMDAIRRTKTWKEPTEGASSRQGTPTSTGK